MRVQLELDDSVSRMIDQIKKSADYEKLSYREFFDIAIGFLNWGVKRVEEGSIIAAVDEEQETYAQITMPLFDRIQQVAAVKKEMMATATAVKATAAAAGR